MSYYRSYFSKNNTIVSGSRVNTAKSPSAQLFYGENFSKYIFKIDLDDLKSKIDNGELVLDSNTKHYLHLTNTIFGDESFLGVLNGVGKERTSSFDLIIFQVDEYWDEGVGFDYEKVVDIQTGYDSDTYDKRPSNWYNRTTLNAWTENGIYSTTPTTTLAIIHFDNGNENINEDITDYVNDILTGGTANYGLGIAFHPDYANVVTEEDQSVAFFSKYTQTYFEPYLETIFVDPIRDDRYNFIANKENNLYLYVTKGGNYYDLDSLPTVDILDNTETPITGLTGLTTTKIRKGVYKVSFGITGSLCTGDRFFYDKWCNLSIDSEDIACVTQKFIPKPYTSKYTIGDPPSEYESYAVKYYGIKLNEKIKRGELRKIAVNFISINSTDVLLLDEVYYRIYIEEGHTQVNVFDWTLFDKTNQNSFYLDTSFMIPREYHLEIKAKINTEEIFYKNKIHFEIVSER